jgi:amino acid transporter
VGFEWVAPLAEETTDYKTVGKGMLWAVGLLSITYSMFIVAMFSGLTTAQLESGSPIPHILFGKNLFGAAGLVTFVIMSILASLTSFNTGILNTSRFAYAMGRDNVLPRVFSRLHPLYATPWVAILFLGCFAIAISLVTLLTDMYFFVIIMAAALECFIYVVAALCVIRLRRRKPDMERSFKVPFGITIPVIVIAVFGLLMLGIFTDVTRDYSGKELFNNYWVAVVMGIFLLCMYAYTSLVVPVYKRRAEERAQTRVKRRPGKA